MDQIELHKKIDKITQSAPNNDVVGVVRELVSANEDARRYFFTKVDERWLDWLWNNGFLDAIKQKSADPTKYSYTLPELDYLARMVEKNPEKVVDIILKVDMSANNFNPEVVDRFLWICGELEAAQIARLVEKIKKEDWVRLMAPFNRWGFEYDKMLKKLVEAKDYKSLLILAEAILLVRTQAEREKSSIFTDDPFCIGLDHIEIFKYLTSVDDKYAESALKLALDKLVEILVIDKDRGEIFNVKENYYLYDVDFFTIDFGAQNHLSSRDNVKDLATAIKKLTERFIGKNCGSEDKIIYEKYFAVLPDSQSFWRLRLFIWSLCPEVFKNELKMAFLRIFEYGEKYYELFGAEYCHALKKGFAIINETDKREYIKRVFDYFGKKRIEEKEDRTYRRDGWKILSCIFNDLSPEDKIEAEKVFGEELDQNFVPASGYGPIRGGMVQNRAPDDLTAYEQRPISEIVKSLCGELSPASLYKKYKGDDFLNPRNAEGVGNWLQQDMKRRPKEYIDNAGLFFQRGVLDEHYTYSFLRGVDDVIRKDDYNFELELDNLLVLFDNVRISGVEDNFTYSRKTDEMGNTWLGDWGAVHRQISDILKILLNEKNEKPLIDFSVNRDLLLDLVKYLLDNPDPDSTDEGAENGSDPFSRAINSVRGRAFEDLALFVYFDGRDYSKEATVKIKEDVKEIYEQVLAKEKTMAVMFMFGHYLPTFYYRDKVWIRELLNKIFPPEPEKRDLFIAALEGFLSANLYKELLEDELVISVYERAISLTSAQYKKRRYFREIDDGIATHLALAYIHFLEFDYNSSLFKLFWQTPNAKRHGSFVSFIGRHLISRDDPENFMTASGIDAEKIRKKLENLWIWILENTNKDEGEVFAHFGFWVGEKQTLFTDLKWLAGNLQKSLEKSGGEIEWEHGVIKKLSELANAAPVETLKILELYLMRQAAIAGSGHFAYFVYVNNIIDAFKILYAIPETKDGVEKLINGLLIKGSNRFWEFKKVIE